MDLIRIYSEVAFSRVAPDFLSNTDIESGSNDNLNFILPEEIFLDSARRYHPELSDDNLRVIYKLGLDDWSRWSPYGNFTDSRNIFQSLACFATDMLQERELIPVVRFNNLFRWRESTQLLGEDLLVCAFLAFKDKDIRNGRDRGFCWPSVLHNDNPHLNYLFRTRGLCELHSHLLASANVFEISWVYFMNHISGSNSKFEKMATLHNPSTKKVIADLLFSSMAKAAWLRWSVYRWIVDDISMNPDKDKIFANRISESATISDNKLASKTDTNTDTDRKALCSDEQANIALDYIHITNSPMAIYAGERWLLYNALRRIYATNNATLTIILYRYILTKSLLRSFFVQINNNIGFSNFQRYDSVKRNLLNNEFNNLFKSLPLWEAKEHNFVKIFETRTSPNVDAKGNENTRISHATKGLKSLLSKITTHTSDQDTHSVENPDLSDLNDWSLLFHFIKREDESTDTPYRNTELRNSIENQSKIISKLPEELLPNPAIDAASSELKARPEVFSQAFRYLRHFGYDATFHVGEDFYDLADGLRAIDEAIHLLQLRSGDRIGHALALGIDAHKYYDMRHNYIALPKQWMLDNVVWLMIRAKQWGISIDPKTDWFLSETYKILCIEIGFANMNDGSSRIPDIVDYWHSMALRGDSPNLYNVSGDEPSSNSFLPDDWDYYAMLDSDEAQYARSTNREARRIYYLYHNNPSNGVNLRLKGNEVKAFRIPDGYSKLITDLQQAMIRQVSKHQLCIECCPSSNVKIGKLDRFDAHPIFRFLPLNPDDTRYPLAVTVNTDDLGIFSTSLPNEFSLLALALLKKKDRNGNHIYSSQEVYDWIARVIDNGHKFTFLKS